MDHLGIVGIRENHLHLSSGEVSRRVRPCRLPLVGGGRQPLAATFVSGCRNDGSERTVVSWTRTYEEWPEKLTKAEGQDIPLSSARPQYARIDYDTYRDMRSRFPRKLLIFISHADGKDPKGGVADSIRYDCSCKIYVEGFRAVAASRYLDHGQKSHPFIIWEEKAVLYYGQDFDQVK